LNGLLLLLGLAETIHPLGPRVVGVLGLEELRLRLLHLFETGLLRLLVSHAATVAILEARRLAVRVVQEAGLLWLLLLYRITEPIYRLLLLVALVEASRLRSLRRSIVKEQVRIVLILQFSLSQLLFLSAQLDGFLQIVIVFTATTCTMLPPRCFRLCFIL